MHKKSLLLLISLLSISQFSFAQYREIKKEGFTFQINRDFNLVESENNRVHFQNTEEIGNVKISQEIILLETKINPKRNNIKKIADFANLQKIHFLGRSNDPSKKDVDNIDGMTRIDGIDLFFSINETKKYETSQHTKLASYTFSLSYRFLFKNKIYLLMYSTKLLNPEKVTDLVKFFNLMERKNNISELNIILESLVINPTHN